MTTATNTLAPVIKGFRTLLLADDALQDLFAAAPNNGTPYIVRRGSVQSVQRIPGIYWSIITQSLREARWSAFVQWAVWAESYDIAVQIGNRLSAVMHHENRPITVGGVAVMSMLSDIEEGADEGDGTVPLIYIFHYQPFRS